MAIAPIQLFQPDNSIASLLQGGSATLGSLMDRAIQSGRSVADRATQQERDFQAARQVEEGLAQRRAELRDLSASRLFSQGMDTARLGLSAAENARQERKMRFDEQRLSAADLFRSEAAKSEAERNKLFGQIAGLPPGTERSPQDKQAFDLFMGSEASPAEKSSAREAFYGTPSPGGRPQDPLIQQGRELTVDKARYDKFKRDSEALFAVPGAFVAPRVWMGEKYGLDENRKIKTGEKGATPQQLDEAARYDKDPLMGEIGYMQQYATADEYAKAKIKSITPEQYATADEYEKAKSKNLTPEQYNARKKLWEAWNSSMNSTETPGGAGVTPLSDILPGLTTP
jgi:hypothetical protein